MAEAGAAAAAPARSKLTASDVSVSARLQQVLALLFPSSLAAKAALLAVVVALLPLLPSSQAPRLWELPHLLLLGVIVSYGVFGQKNADGAEVVASSKPVDDDDDDEQSAEAFVSEMMQGTFAFERNVDRDEGDGVQAWSSRYLPDDPLVVVADNGSNDGKGEKPIHLPVRKLNPTDKVPATVRGDISEAISSSEEEEKEEVREFLAPKAGYGLVHERAIPSPSSVLDADLSLSPSSPPLLPPPPPPPPPPFLGGGQKAKARSFNEFGTTNGRMGLLQGARSNNNKQFRSKSAVQATRSAFADYDPAGSLGYEAAGDKDGELDEMIADDAATDSSFSRDDDLLTDNDDEENSYEEEDSCDEELFELATRPGLEADEVEEVEDEVDRKAEEFIAKFRDQIRMQRIEPARR